MEDLRSAFGKAIAPIHVPIGEEMGLRGLVRVATARAYEYQASNPKGTQVDLPDDVSALVEEAHTGLIETVVETDDKMMEAYFEGNEPTREQIVSTIHNGIVSGDPALASAEAGKAFADHIVATTVALVEHLKTVDPRSQGRTP